jgi:hypothetical protein
MKEDEQHSAQEMIKILKPLRPKLITCTIGKNCNFADRQNIDYVLQEELVHGGQDEMAILCLILSLTEKSNVMPLLQTNIKQTQQCELKK